MTMPQLVHALHEDGRTGEVGRPAGQEGKRGEGGRRPVGDTRAYLGFAQALAGGGLPRRLREQIALAVGEANACTYCVAAHTALGAGACP
jgi:alkylhydroperoxidase family enzyme